LALPTPPAAHDQAVRGLVLLTGAVAERRHAPLRHGGTARGRGALATAVRMVDRVHRRAARLRAHAHVTLAAGLADGDVLVVGVADSGSRPHGDHTLHI